MCLAGGEGIYCILDDAGYEKLEGIYQQKGGEPQKQSETVLNEIYLKRFEILQLALIFRGTTAEKEMGRPLTI